MYAPNAYVIRYAGRDDVAALERLAELDSQPRLRGHALIGEVDGRATAAIGIADRRVIADPFVPTDHLAAHLRIRAAGVEAAESRPSLRERIVTALRPAAVKA